MSASYVIAQTESVEALLRKAYMAVSPSSMSMWLRTYMGPELQRRAGERFATQSGPDGQAWAPLSEATIRIREEQGYWPGLINWRTGEMERYVSQAPAFAAMTGDGAWMKFPGDEPTGEMREKFITAQEGRDGSGNSHPQTPARPFLGMDSADAAFALASLEAWLTVTITTGGMGMP